MGVARCASGGRTIGEDLSKLDSRDEDIDTGDRGVVNASSNAEVSDEEGPASSVDLAVGVGDVSSALPLPLSTLFAFCRLGESIEVEVLPGLACWRVDLVRRTRRAATGTRMKGDPTQLRTKELTVNSDLCETGGNNVIIITRRHRAERRDAPTFPFLHHLPTLLTAMASARPGPAHASTSYTSQTRPKSQVPLHLALTWLAIKTLPPIHSSPLSAYSSTFTASILEIISEQILEVGRGPSTSVSVSSRLGPDLGCPGQLPGSAPPSRSPCPKRIRQSRPAQCQVASQRSTCIG